MYYIAGRIYARAASAAAGEVRQAGRSAVALTASYQDRAVALIREAVRRTSRRTARRRSCATRSSPTRRSGRSSAG